MPYVELPSFMEELRQQDGMAARALEFLILTAGRTGEVIGVRWAEFEPMEQRIWTIPGSRMKVERQHRVPLSEPAFAIVEQLHHVRSSDFVFSVSRHRRLSDTAMYQLFRRMGQTVSVQGSEAPSAL